MIETLDIESTQRKHSFLILDFLQTVCVIDKVKERRPITIKSVSSSLGVTEGDIISILPSGMPSYGNMNLSFEAINVIVEWQIKQYKTYYENALKHLFELRAKDKQLLKAFAERYSKYKKRISRWTDIDLGKLEEDIRSTIYGETSIDSLLSKQIDKTTSDMLFQIRQSYLYSSTHQKAIPDCSEIKETYTYLFTHIYHIFTTESDHKCYTNDLRNHIVCLTF